MVRNWLIQSSDIRRTNETIRGLLDTLDSGEVPWIDFGMMSFTPEITNWESVSLKDKHFPYGSTKMLRTLTNPDAIATDIFIGADPMHAIYLLAKFREGVFYDADAFDQSKPWAKRMAPHMLNGGADTTEWYLKGLLDRLNNVYVNEMFVKPASDGKLFAGGIMKSGETFRQFMNRTQVDGDLADHSKDIVLVSTYKELLAEWRFFVVDENVVACSQYRKHGKLEYDVRVPAYVFDYAEHLATLYQPAKAFVMDVCLTYNLDLKIVEYNCINCSGLYFADPVAIAKALDKL